MLNRKPLADALTNVMKSIQDSAVIALDGAWGSGKTTFLKMWSQQLQDTNIPVIEFNAWETDFSDDPLVALSAEVIQGLKTIDPKFKRKRVEIQV